MTSSTNEKELDDLYEWRLFVEKERINISHSLDKYIFTFATGVLTLSVSITSSLKKTFCFTDYLAVGWMMLIYAIIFTLLSIFLSEKAFRREIYITDEIIKCRNRKGDENELNTSNIWNKAVDIFTIVGMITFIIGIAFLSIFYFKNLY